MVGVMGKIGYYVVPVSIYFLVYIYYGLLAYMANSYFTNFQWEVAKI